MTLNQIVKAYANIDELSKLILPYPVTRDLFRLKKRLKEEFDTIIMMENALVENHGGVKNEDGSYKFPDVKNQKEFVAAYGELMTKDQDVRLPLVNLSRYTTLLMFPLPG